MDIKRAKLELEKARVEADAAESVADLTKAAEIRYARIPHLEKEIETAAKRLKKLCETGIKKCKSAVKTKIANTRFSSRKS